MIICEQLLVVFRFRYVTYLHVVQTVVDTRRDYPGIPGENGNGPLSELEFLSTSNSTTICIY